TNTDEQDAPRKPSRRADGSIVREPIRRERTFTGLQSERAPDYVVIGHICADLLPDGTAVLGGTALYSALTAASLGWRVGILTRGRYGQNVDGINVPSLDPYADKFSMIVQEAERPTVFVNEYQAGRRVQTVPHWGGQIDLRGLPPHWRNAKVIHLGPIAQEIDMKETGGLTPEFLGVTPQGWMREWPRSGGRVKLNHLRIAPKLLSRIDGVIVSEEEISLSRDTVDQVGSRRLAVITRGEWGSRVVYAGAHAELPGYKIAAKDLTGAGDVFATAFFIKATERSVSAVNAARFANAVAALSLREIGPNGIPTLDEVDAFLKDAVEVRR
ncbi:MAG: PfkB family carbohydrate kinase, partial [Thermomicrobiales bacterium]